MRLERVTFVFDKIIVEFFGESVSVFEQVSTGWKSKFTISNPWTRRGTPDDGGVMGRKYKPRVTDALKVYSLSRRAAKQKTQPGRP